MTSNIVNLGSVSIHAMKINLNLVRATFYGNRMPRSLLVYPEMWELNCAMRNAILPRGVDARLSVSLLASF
jgi:hypothetical protein